jgi:hypothetical protein
VFYAPFSVGTRATPAVKRKAAVGPKGDLQDATKTVSTAIPSFPREG